MLGFYYGGQPYAGQSDIRTITNWALTASISGDSSVVGAVKVTDYYQAAAFGDANITSGFVIKTVVAPQAISGDSTATASVTITTPVKFLSASVSGDSTVTAQIFRGANFFSASAGTGDSSASAALVLTTALSASVTGDAVATAPVGMTRTFQASVSGDSTASASTRITYFFRASVSGDATSSGAYRLNILFTGHATGDSDYYAQIFQGEILVTPGGENGVYQPDDVDTGDITAIETDLPDVYQPEKIPENAFAATTIDETGDWTTP